MKENPETYDEKPPCEPMPAAGDWELVVPGDFALPHTPEHDDPIRSAGGEESPQIVVVYRDRWRWLPAFILPALLGVLAAWVVMGQARRPFRTGLERQRVAASRPDAREQASPSDAAPALELQVRSVPALEPPAQEEVMVVAEPDSAEAAAAALETPVVSASEPVSDTVEADLPPPPAAIGFDRPGEAPAVALADVDEAAATKAAMDEIQRAAEAKHRERLELERARDKPAEVARDAKAVAARARARLEPLAAQAELTRRDAFRAQLAGVLRDHGEMSGPYLIAMLRTELGNGLVMGLGKGKAAQAGSTRSASLDPGRRVAQLRAQGQSEPMILRELISLEMGRLGGRGGISNPNLAVVRAARQLLAAPMPSALATSARAARRTAVERAQGPN